MLRLGRHNARFVAGAVVLLALLVPRAALAHVVVLPVTVPTATSQVFTIRVPTEKEVPTISVRIEFPTNMVVARFEPMPGWRRAVDRDGAGRIVAATWSGGAIAADEYQDFVFLGRTPREPGVLVFPAYQTYEDGETVAWTEAPDQDHPAPTVEVFASDAALAETAVHMEAATTVGEAIATPVATMDVEAATPTSIVVSEATAAPVAPSGVQNAPELAAGSAGVDEAGSDLPLFLALGSFAASLVAVALAAVALARRPAAP